MFTKTWGMESQRIRPQLTHQELNRQEPATSSGRKNVRNAERDCHYPQVEGTHMQREVNRSSRQRPSIETPGEDRNTGTSHFYSAYFQIFFF